MNTDALYAYSGCYVDTNFTGGVLITGNRFGNFIYTTPKQRYRIVIALGADNVIATSNDLRLNQSGGLLNASPSATHINIADNLV